jgi:hypothetical protein
MTDADIQSLKRITEFQGFIDYVRTVTRSLDSLENIDFTQKESAVIEALARRKTVETLEKILAPFMELRSVSADLKREKEQDAGVA